MIRFFDVESESFLNFKEEDIIPPYFNGGIKIKSKYYRVLFDKQDKIYYVFASSKKKSDIEAFKIDNENKYVIQTKLNNHIYGVTYGTRKNIPFSDKPEINVGDKCICGNLKECSVVGKDNRGYYYIKHYSKGNHDYLVSHWFDVFPIIENPAVIERNENLVSYSNTTIESIIHRVVHFGVDFNPEYQRGDVWNEDQKVKLIDSIFKNINIGSVVFAEKSWFSNNVISEMYEVVDGKQRITAILEYIQNKFQYKGKYFYEISNISRNEFLESQILVGEIKLRKSNGKDEYDRSNVIKQFIRLNECGTTMDKEVIEKAKGMI